MPQSFVDRYVSQRPHCIHKLKAKDTTGQWAYYFVLVEPPREKAFLATIRAQNEFDLGDYGKVIASCYGEEPNEYVKQLLRDKYGFDI